MSETELVIQTIANGEAMLGIYDYEKLGWIKPPRFFVVDIGAR